MRSSCLVFGILSGLLLACPSEGTDGTSDGEASPVPDAEVVFASETTPTDIAPNDTEPVDTLVAPDTIADTGSPPDTIADTESPPDETTGEIVGDTTTPPEGDTASPPDTGPAPPCGSSCVLFDLSTARFVLQNEASARTEAGDRYGAALASGDTDGDGFDDVLAGAPGENDGAGAIFRFPGASGEVGAGTFSFQTVGGGAEEAGDLFGSSLATGDIDGDQRADVAVGAPGENGGTGVIVILPGTESGALTSGRFYFIDDLGCGARGSSDAFGTAVALRDLDADGHADLVVGAPGANDGAGIVCIAHGRSDGSLDSNGRRLTAGAAAEAGAGFGTTLALARLDAGASLDLIVGAPAAAGGVGRVHILYAASAATSETLGPPAFGPSPTRGFGLALATADFDRDGWSDLAVGAPDGGPGGLALFPATTWPAGRWWARTDEATGDLFGAALAAADFNGDGFDDLVAGAPGAMQAAGLVVALPGHPDGLQPGFVITGADLGGANEADDGLGAALATGDIDGDERADLIIGSPTEAPFSEPAGGLVTLLYGGTPLPKLTHGPILGAVTDTSVKVWIRTNLAVDWSVTARAPDGSTVNATGGAIEPAFDHTAVARLDRLQPATRYEYTVALAGAVVSRGIFDTLPPPDQPSVVTIAYGADIHLNSRPYILFDQALNSGADLILLGGDNIYADSPTTVANTAEGYFARYRQTFGDQHLRDALARVPAFMMWDDHEISNDWYVGKNGRYDNARLAFDRYQGLHNPDPIDAGALYYRFRAGGAELFVLDCRSYRSPNNTADGPSKTMLGATQRAALLAWLTESRAPFKIIASSVPFNRFATTADDGWNGLGAQHGAFRTERDQILSHVVEQGIDGVVLLSGDQHWSGAFRIPAPGGGGEPFYELMPTPLAAFSRDAPSSTSDEILYKSDAHLTLGILTVDTTVSPARLTVKYVDRTGDTRYMLTLDTDQLAR